MTKPWRIERDVSGLGRKWRSGKTITTNYLHGGEWRFVDTQQDQFTLPSALRWIENNHQRAHGRVKLSPTARAKVFFVLRNVETGATVVIP